MPAARILHYVFWIGPAGLQCAIICLMLRRKLQREYPVFFAYTVFHVLRFALLFGYYLLSPQRESHAAYVVYFGLYWTTEVVNVLLTLGVIYEVFSHILRSYAALRSLGLLLMRWMAAALFLAGVLVAAASPGSQASRVLAGMLLLDRSILVLECGLLLFLFLFSSYFGLRWNQFLFGIAFGLGIAGSLELTATTLRMHVGASIVGLVVLLKTGADTIGALVWLVYAVLPEPAPETIRVLPHNDVEKWNQALSELIYR